ncbi:MAG: metalloregulator ArsR/SmtB family transcription factor [Bacillales bacterium]|jgi:ArsR family transcriptional regulator|nr:metalloregulator ArsR/SmtB family transcription factor [Bacillales bacterium]
MEQQILFDLADFFKIMSDSTRIRILDLLYENALTVNSICEKLSLQQTTVSHQLRLLKMSKLLESKKEGRNIFYCLKDEHIFELLRISKEHLEE